MYCNEHNVPMMVNHVMLNKLRMDKGVTFPKMKDDISVAEGTLKNIFGGRTPNPGGDTMNKICKYLGISIESAYIPINPDAIKTHFETQGIREDEISIVALKEIYEHNETLLKETTEAHIENIRSHYEQHHDDLKENYEKRLADKREIIDAKNEHIKTLEKECRHAKIFSWICVFVLVVLLIAEVANPNLGWLRF